MYLLSFLDRGKTLSLDKHTVKCRKLNKTISVHCATLCRKAKLIETILWGKDICNTFSNGPYKNFHLMVLHRYPIKDQVTITKRLEPLQNTELSKKFSTSYLFEKQGTSEGSEYFGIDFEWVLLTPIMIWLIWSFRTFRDPLLLKQITDR